MSDQPFRVFAMFVLLGTLAVISTWCTGCGAGVLGVQADLVAAGGIAAAQADAQIVEARSHDLDSIVDEARETCGADGCTDEEASSFRTRLDAAERRWAPVLACRGPVIEALGAWLDGIETAAIAQSSELGLELLVRLGLRFVATYAALVVCVEAAAPDVDLPELPPELAAIGGAS